MNPPPCSCYAYILAQDSEKRSGKVPQEKHVLNLLLASTLKVKGPVPKADSSESANFPDVTIDTNIHAELKSMNESIIQKRSVRLHTGASCANSVQVHQLD